jgi:N utilization substance protein B
LSGSDAKGGRSQARERALSLLYEAEAKGVSPASVVAALPVVPDAYAVMLAQGVADHADELDRTIGRFARGWRLERMPAIDRTLLRMAAFELAHRPDIPTAVAIAEAVALAKQFSTEDSSRFVNGVLAKVAAELRPH